MKCYKDVPTFGGAIVATEGGKIFTSEFVEIPQTSGSVKIGDRLYSVGDLIALTFIGVRGFKERLKYLDGNSKNNHVDNLDYRRQGC